MIISIFYESGICQCLLHIKSNERTNKVWDTLNEKLTTELLTKIDDPNRAIALDQSVCFIIYANKQLVTTTTIEKY